MKGKTRILLDDKTEYMAVVETLSSRILELNRDRDIYRDEEYIRKLQENLQQIVDVLASHVKARNQMLETLKKLNAVKKQKDIDVIMPNPSEKITLDSLREYLMRADKRASIYFELKKKGLPDKEARKKAFEEVPEE